MLCKNRACFYTLKAIFKYILLQFRLLEKNVYRFCCSEGSVRGPMNNINGMLSAKKLSEAEFKEEKAQGLHLILFDSLDMCGLVVKPQI